MWPFFRIEMPYVFIYIPLRLLDRIILIWKPFRFHFSTEAFHWSIIPAVSFSAHTAKKIIPAYQLPVFRCTVGGTSIRVYDTAGLSTSSHDHIIKFIHYKLFIVASAHRDPYGHISIQIQNTGYVEFSLSGRDHCCIANTAMVAALVDRLTFRSYILDMNGYSYRLDHSKNGA